MEKLLLSEIAVFCGSETVLDRDIEITDISTDSRAIGPGELFIPLVGDTFDGHDYIESAAQNGAAAALSAKRAQPLPIPVLEVEDTLRAYQAIAAHYKDRFAVRTVGVTGSVGKTSTKEMIAAVLSARCQTLKNEGNLNNEIGVPRSVLRLNRSHEAAVFEMGMNHFGELSRISRVTKPDIAVITNIGVAHIEYLGSREGILKAKTEIFEGLKKNGAVVLNGDDELLLTLRGRLPYPVVYYGIENADCDIRAESIAQDDKGISFTIMEKDTGFACYVPALGMHNVYNALAAAAVGRLCGLTREEIRSGLSGLETNGLRQHVFEEGGITVIDDAYNANPDSMRAALSVLAQLPVTGRRIAVLGGMLELGPVSPEAHHGVGSLAAQKADLLFVYGSGSDGYAEGAVSAGMARTRIRSFDTHEAIARALRKEAAAGDAVLFKGSAGMKMKEALRIWQQMRV